MSTDQERAGLCLGCGEVFLAPTCPRCSGRGTSPAGLEGAHHPYREGLSGGPCPRCESPLQPDHVGSTPIETCAGCHGVMIATGVVAAWTSAEADTRIERNALALALPVHRYQRERGIQYAKCPRCGVLMNRKVFGRVSGVIVDVCAPHGVWFDAGELGAVLEFLDHGGLEKAKRLEAEDRARSREQARTSSTPSLPSHGSTHHQQSEQLNALFAAFRSLFR